METNNLFCCLLLIILCYPATDAKNATRTGRSSFLPPTVTSFHHPGDLAASPYPWPNRQVLVGRQVGGGNPIYMSRPSHLGLGSHPSPQYMSRMMGMSGRMSPAATAVVAPREPMSEHKPMPRILPPRLSIPQSDMGVTERPSRKKHHKKTSSKDDQDYDTNVKTKKKEKAKSRSNKENININLQSQPVWGRTSIQDYTFNLPITEDLSHLENEGPYSPRWTVEDYPSTTDKLGSSQDIWAIKRYYSQLPGHLPIHQAMSQHPNVNIQQNPNPGFYPTSSNFPQHAYPDDHLYRLPNHGQVPAYISTHRPIILNTNQHNLNNMNYDDFITSHKGTKLKKNSKTLNVPQNKQELIFIDEDTKENIVDNDEDIKIRNKDSKHRKRGKNRKSKKNKKKHNKLRVDDTIANSNNETEELDLAYSSTSRVPDVSSTSYYNLFSTFFQSENATTETDLKLTNSEAIYNDDELSYDDDLEEMTTIMPFITNENITDKLPQYHDNLGYDSNSYNSNMPTEWRLGESIPTKIEPIASGYKFPKHVIIIASCILGTLAFFTVFVLIAYTVVKCSKKPVKNNYEVSTHKTVLSNNSF